MKFIPVLFFIFSSAHAASIDDLLGSINRLNDSKPSCAPPSEVINCDRPAASFCSNARLDEVKQKAETISKKILESVGNNGPLSNFESRNFLKQMQDLQDQVLLQFGLHTSDIAKLFEKIRAREMKELRTNPHITASEKAEFTDRLSKLVLRSPETLLKSGNEHDVIFSAADYSDLCGANGMTLNAYNLTESKDFMICPGFLLQELIASNGNLEALTQMIGHEVGHSIDSVAYPSDPRFRTPAKSYESFMACVKETDAEKHPRSFKTNDQFIADLSRALKVTDATRIAAAEDPNIDRVQFSAIANRETMLQQNLAREQQMIAVEKTLGLDPSSPVAAKHRELIADQFGIKALSDNLSSTDLAKNRWIMQGVMQLYCQDVDAGGEKMGILMERAHPASSIRMEEMMRSAEIRKALGCRASTDKVCEL